MKLLPVLIAVFMVSGAVAQDFDGNDVVTCNGVKGNSAWSCKDPNTGKTQVLKCKKPLKQIMPPKDRPTVMTMAKLKKACGLLDGLEDIDSNG